jgi:hypothetical protein
MKGILTNKGYKIITNVLWIVALLGMIGLLIITKQLSSEVKELKGITTNRK